MMKRWIGVWILAAVLSACQSFTRDDPQAELRTEIDGYVQEATALAATLAVNERRVGATAEAASTRVAAMNSINVQLLATVRAGEAPTVGVESSVGLPGGGSELTPGQRYFNTTGVAMRVRDSDGCVENPITAFPEGVQSIYATAVAYNISAGTSMSAEWYYGEERVANQTYQVARTASSLCLWFFIDPTDAPLLPGEWSVRLYADGSLIQGPMNFRVGDAMTSGG
ncbi:MAG: hypothetical protein K8I60_17575 [Anaerolineae bacterium]|nr:hypothetical protein [Anaerolineae bacterium]